MNTQFIFAQVKSKISFIVIAFFMVFNLCAMANAEESVTYQDMAQRKVTVTKNPERILCLGPGALRLIVYLNAQDKLCGIEEIEVKYPVGRPYYMAHPELGKIKTVTPGGVAGINNKPDMEKVLSVNPQVIFATHMEPKLADTIQATLNTPVVLLDYGRFANFDSKVLDSLQLAGKILDKEQRAEKVVNFIKNSIKDLAKRCQSHNKPKVYIGGIGYKGAHGLESTDTQYSPFLWCQAQNACQEKGNQSHKFIDKEQLLNLDPDIIFVDGTGFGVFAADYAKKPEFYQLLKAFKNKNLYVLHPFNWYTTNIGTALVDAYAIGKILYPQNFKDLDTPQKADEIYKALVGKKIHSQMAAQYGKLAQKAPFLK